MEKSSVLDCSDCGLCCVRQGKPPYTPEEGRKLPKDLRIKLEAYVNSARGRENWRGPCPLYDVLDNKCRVYGTDAMPQACIDYEFNGPKCQEMVQIKIIGDGVAKGMRKWQLNLKSSE